MHVHKRYSNHRPFPSREEEEEEEEETVAAALISLGEKRRNWGNACT